MIPIKPLNKRKLLIAILVATTAIKMGQDGNSDDEIRQYISTMTCMDEVVLDMVVKLIEATQC